jgi:4-amino-4-deoxy-L-arabinose transferase-like glycosyltransferase
VFLTYKIGETFYGKRTGLFAAALFALTPWLLIMSRVMLIDIFCLFFSMLCLLTGIWAIRKDSSKLFLLAGAIFGVALLTKLFAVFILVPCAILFFYPRSKIESRMAMRLALFLVPTVLLQYAWYGVLSGKGFFSLFGHDDLGNRLLAGFVASPFYSVGFMVEILGAFFVIGCFVSILVSIALRRRFLQFFTFDLACISMIMGVIGFNLSLVFFGNLIVPYVNSIKYNFLTLPMLCLIAASIAKKCMALSPAENSLPKSLRLVFYGAWAGFYLIIISMFATFFNLTNLAKDEWVSFVVPGNLSYSFIKMEPVFGSSQAWVLQALGFSLLQLSLLWANRNRIRRLFSSL